MFHYVYFIRSILSSDAVYVGYTTDLKKRLEAHNAGDSFYTKRNKPWKLIFCIGFEDKYKALTFEQYLKTHAGRAFTKKRLL